MKEKDNTVTLDGIELIHETDSAVLIGYGDEQYWIPLSQVEAWDNTSITMTEWIAEQKGLA